MENKCKSNNNMLFPPDINVETFINTNSVFFLRSKRFDVNYSDWMCLFSMCYVQLLYSLIYFRYP